MTIGIFRSPARSAAAKSPPMADPPMPQSTMLRTSAYAGGMFAALPIFQASRTCVPRSLMRSSMLSLSAARMRSTVSITDVSTSATHHHPLSRVERGLELVLRARLRVDAYERLGPREADQEPRPVVQEVLHAVFRVEENGLAHRVARDLPRTLGVEPLHDLDLLLRVRRCLEMEVAPQVEGWAGHVHQLRDELARLLLRLQHEVQEEEV